MNQFAIKAVKSLFFATPLYKYFLPIMKFDMSIPQLAFLLDQLNSTKCNGCVLEIGVGGGATSVILNQQLRNLSVERPFVALDTFDGFCSEDIDYERSSRGKSSKYPFYRSNSLVWYKKTLAAHGFPRAEVFAGDCKSFDYTILGPIAFCLFDVDLYLPTKVALPRIYQSLEPGGVIVVDDCDLSHELYDGAGVAYLEFCKEMNIDPIIVCEKLGLIRKPG